MPKMKSHSGMGKKVRVTGSGRILRQHAGRVHKFERKPSTLTRRLAGTVEVSSADRRRIKKLLGR